MNIFEKLEQTATELGKKTQDLASDTKVKADNAIQISKLNNKIGEKKRENDVLHRQLGEAYYVFAKGNGEEEKLSQLIEKISTNLTEIEDINKQIEGIKNSENAVPVDKKTCPKCGSVVSKDAVFCTKCGNKFEEVEK